jgi:dihydroorotase
MKLLIKSATIITPGNSLHRKKRDILIENGKIKNIATSIKDDKAQVYTKPNLHVSVGWMDTNVSFGEPGFEERETLENGLKVAALSGFTAIGLQADTQPVMDNATAVSFVKNSVLKSPTSVHPIPSFTLGSAGKDMAELYDMQQKGAIAFYDFKRTLDNANLLKMGLLYARSFDGLLMSFPQEKSTSYEGKANESAYTLSLGFEGSPNLSEELQVSRDLQLLAYAQAKLFIPTITTEGAVKLLKEAHKKGLQVSASVSAHHLFMTDEVLENYETRFKVNPPLRTEKDRKAMVRGVKDGTIMVITSDHRPMDIENKKKEFSYAKQGTIGLESFFGAVNSVLDLDDLIPCITTNPRTIFKLPQPEIKEGVEANLTFFNPEENYVFAKEHILSTSDNAAFLGMKLKGIAYGVFNNGKLESK